MPPYNSIFPLFPLFPLCPICGSHTAVRTDIILRVAVGGFVDYECGELVLSIVANDNGCQLVSVFRLEGEKSIDDTCYWDKFTELLNINTKDIYHLVELLQDGKIKKLIMIGNQ